MKNLKDAMKVILLLFIGIPLIVIILSFLVAISPVLGVCFIAYQIKEYFIVRNENKTRLDAKLLQNRDYLRYQFKLKTNKDEV